MAFCPGCPSGLQLDAVDSTEPLAVLQPAAPLKHATRYIVAVCAAVGEWGDVRPPTPGFAQLVEVGVAAVIS